MINIEVQKANDDNHQKRVRYNGAILTTNITDTSSKFENVPDVCIVFISKFDVFNSGYSLYNIDRIVRQTGEVVNNGFEEIYVSACVKDGSDVSELMDIFTNDESYNVNKYPVTSNDFHMFLCGAHIHDFLGCTYFWNTTHCRKQELSIHPSE